MKIALLVLSAALFLSSCGESETRTYQVPKSENAPASMPMAKKTVSVAAPASPAAMSAPANHGFTADLPEGWTETPGSGMRKISYSIEGTSIDFYLISLSMGDVPSNVNRWRGQVGLTDATPEAIEKDIISFNADGHTIKYIEIYNPEGGKGILAAIVDLSPQYWYFTAKGSVEELKAHSADIQSFLKTIKFTGHNH